MGVRDMGESSFAAAAQAVASSLAPQLVSNSELDNLSLEELVEYACFMQDTKHLFQQQGIDLDDDSIQLEVLCEFQKAMTDEIVKISA
jgi:hypothetical protein